MGIQPTLRERHGYDLLVDQLGSIFIESDGYSKTVGKIKAATGEGNNKCIAYMVRLVADGHLVKEKLGGLGNNVRYSIAKPSFL